MEIPQTPKEIVFSSPMRFRKEKAESEDYSAVVHLQLEGEDGGDFTVSIQNNEVEVTEGLVGAPGCVAKMKASLYVDLEWDRTSPQIAFMMGKIKVTNPMELIKFIGLFRNMKRQFGNA